jgi:hypothetical protein
MVASNDHRIVYRLAVEADPATRRVLDDFARQAAATQNRISRSAQQGASQSGSGTADREQQRADQRAAREKAAADRQIAQWQRQAEAQDARDQKTAAKEKANRAKQNDKDTQAFIKDGDRKQGAAERKAKAGEREAVEKTKLAQERLNDSLDKGLDATMKLVRGFVLMGSTGEKDTRKILDNLLLVQGAIDGIRGGVDAFKGLSGFLKNVKEASTLTKLAGGAAKAGGLGGGGAVSGVAGAIGALGPAAIPVAAVTALVAAAAGIAVLAKTYGVEARNYAAGRGRTGVGHAVDLASGVAGEAITAGFSRLTNWDARASEWFASIGETKQDTTQRHKGQVNSAQRLSGQKRERRLFDYLPGWSEQFDAAQAQMETDFQAEQSAKKKEERHANIARVKDAESFNERLISTHTQQQHIAAAEKYRP